MTRIFQLLFQGVGPAPSGKYRHWDTIRRQEPPQNATQAEWWAAIKLARSQTKKNIPGMLDKRGLPFHYTMPDPLLEMLHQIDKLTSGHIHVPEPIINISTKDRYIQTSLIEEAITSSQLEGAATTGAVAKEMIRTGRRPVNKDERMILNNYLAMRHLSQLSHNKFSPELIDQLHKILIQDTYPAAASYRRTPNDGIAVRDSATGQVLHSPPKAEEIAARMQRMCDFANQTETTVFLHPVLKAIMLHFWLAYDHPYKDGNGRTARALFYWSMLSQGFWLFEYISISTIIRKGPVKYGRSFLYTETDENDLTYFLLAQLKIITRSIDQLYDYLETKAEEQRGLEQRLQNAESFNHRQIALIGHALKHAGMKYSFESHRSSHRIAYQTARTDLLELVSKGLLVKKKRGKKFIFEAVHGLADRLMSYTTGTV